MGNCCGVARGEEDPGKIKVQPKELGKAKPETNDVEAKDIEVDKITNDASKTVDIENEDPEEIQPDIQLPGTPKEPEIREQETKKSDPVSYVLFFPDERVCIHFSSCYSEHQFSCRIKFQWNVLPLLEPCGISVSIEMFASFP